VPSECRFDFEFRNLPTLDPEEIFACIEAYAREALVPQMRREHPNAAIEFVKVAVAPGFNATEQAEVTQLVRELTGNQDKRKVTYGTEAGLFEQAGIPSVICGPGNIEQAHKANEYVELTQLADCQQFVRKFIRSMSVDVY
jgi:acetylornithine deacetylase